VNDLPRAGWYPDPETGGASWRWWDGSQWAPPGYGYPSTSGSYDPAAFARLLEAQADTTRRTGRWLRIALAGNALGTFSVLVLAVLAFHGRRAHFATTDPDGTVHLSRWVYAAQGLALPFDFMGFALLVLLIGWIYNAGKFADSQRWPTIRSRVLGAFSLLIPIVQVWWPYEAVRDLYPPGLRSPLVLRWWLAYLLVPFAAFVVVVIGLVIGPIAVCLAALAVAAGLLAIPVRLGWRLVEDVDAMQQAHLMRPD
jgi:hypothetical protein